MRRFHRSEDNDTCSELLDPLGMQIELGCRRRCFTFKAIPKREFAEHCIAHCLLPCQIVGSKTEGILGNQHVGGKLDLLGFRFTRDMPVQRHKANQAISS